MSIQPRRQPSRIRARLLTFGIRAAKRNVGQNVGQNVGRTLLAAGTAVWLAAAMGCRTDGNSVTQPKNGISTLPWKLTLNYKGITMQTGQSLQLQATATTAGGDTLSGLPAITWTSSDTGIKVDATGKITSHTPVAYARVIAKIQDMASNWTIADTAIVTTSDTLYHFTQYKMWLDGPTVVPLNVWRNYDAVLTDGSGQPLVDEDGDVIYPNTYYFTTAPTSQYSLGTGGGQGNNLGTVKVWASAWIFGTVYRDSVTLQFISPDTVHLYIQRVSPSATPSPSAMSQTDITILQGGVVYFYNQNPTLPADIEFDDLTQAVGGNIPVVPTSYPGAPVTFPNAGKFTYHSSLGFQGTITVVAQ